MRLAFECDHCFKKYKCDDSRHQHLVKFHGYEPRDYQCDQCPKKFRWKNHLNAHMAAGHKYANVRLECGLCPSTFKYHHHYQQHMKIAHDPTKRTYECKECFRTFARRDNFIVHLKNEHAPKCIVHKCQVCHKVYKNKAGLKLHFDMNHREKVARSKCPFCPSEFKWPQHLKQHMSKMHIRQSYSPSENVMDVKHLGNQINRCILCMVPFTSKFDMLLHLRKKHNLDVDVYKCCQCEAVFTLKDPLRIHLQEQHINSTHQCVQCYPAISPLPFIEDSIPSTDDETTIDKELEDFQEALMADEQLRRYVRYKLKHIKTNQHYTRDGEDLDEDNKLFNEDSLDSNWDYPDVSTDENDNDAYQDSVCDINPQLVCEVTINANPKSLSKMAKASDEPHMNYNSATPQNEPSQKAEQMFSGRDDTNTLEPNVLIGSRNSPAVVNGVSSKIVLDKELVVQIERINIKDLRKSVVKKDNTQYGDIEGTGNDKEEHEHDDMTGKKIVQSENKSLFTETAEFISSNKGNKIQLYECSKCDYTFKLQKTLDQHVKFAHSSLPEKLNCKSCTAVFEDQISLNKHKKLHFGESLIFKCDVCSLFFEKRFLLNKHREMHTAQKLKAKEYEFSLEMEDNNQPDMTKSSLTIEHPTEEISAAEKPNLKQEKDNKHITKNLRPKSKKGIDVSTRKSSEASLTSKSKNSITESAQQQEVKSGDGQLLNETNNKVTEADIDFNDIQSSKTKNDLVKYKENAFDKAKMRKRKIIDENINLRKKHLDNVNSPKCSNCNKTLIDKDDVSNHVCKKIKCKHCKLTFYKVLDVARHVKFEHILPLKEAMKKSYKCQQLGCNLSFDKVIDLARHSRFAHKKTPKHCINKVTKRHSIHKCKYCSMKFESSLKLGVHMTAHKKNCKSTEKMKKKRLLTTNKIQNVQAQTIIDKLSAEPNNVHIENYLKEQFNINRDDTPSPISEVSKKKSEKSYECGKCVLFFPSKLELLRHISDIHMYIPDIEVLIETAPKTRRSVVKSLQCNNCDANFINKQQLIEHIKNTHAEPKSYHCISCSEIFKREDAYQEHIKMKHQNKCGICNLNFVRQEKLYYHIKSQHKEKKSHKCTKCDAVFKLKFSLARHMDEFHTPKVVPQITNAKVRVTDELKKRMHMCVHCNALFPLQASLQRHIEWQHSEERRLHKCGQCTAIFNDIEELVEHMQIEHRAEVLHNN